MSGVAEASLVIGLISGLIAIVEATKKIYDAAGDPSGLPQAFREVAQRLPLVQDTLRVAEEQLKAPDRFPSASYAAVKDIVENCKAKAEKLEAIFQKCVPAADASAFDRYRKVLRGMGKEDKVELLMKSLMENVQQLANNSAVRSATEDQVTKIAVAIDALSALKPSISDEMIESSVTGQNVHTGTGDQFTADGSAVQFNAKGNAKQFQATMITFGGML